MSVTSTVGELPLVADWFPVATINNSDVDYRKIFQMPLADPVTGLYDMLLHTNAALSTLNVTDNLGVTWELPEGVMPVDGSRLVQNYLHSTEDFSDSSWVLVGTTNVTGTNQVNFPAENDQIRQPTVNDITKRPPAGNFAFRIFLSGSGTITISIREAAGSFSFIATKQVTLSSQGNVFSISASSTETVFNVYVRRIAGDTATTVFADQAQLESGMLLSNEYKPVLGEFVYPVEWDFYNRLNGNTVDPITGVVAEAPGALIDPPPFFRHAPEATNYFWNSFVPVTQTVSGIPAGDVTVSLDGTGSIVLSGDATGTVTAGNPVSFTGTGADLICTLSGTATKAQVENNPFATPFIETATAPVIRYVQQMEHPYSSEYFNQAEGTLVFRFVVDSIDAAGQIGLLTLSESYASVAFENNDSGSIRSYDGADVSVASGYNQIIESVVTCVVMWSVDSGIFQVGFALDGSSYTKGAEKAYSGQYGASDFIRLFYGNDQIRKLEIADIYDKYQGWNWIEENYS